MGDFSDDGLLCTFSNIPAALAAENVRSLKPRQVVRHVRAGGTVRQGRRYGPFITVPRLAGR